MVRACGFCACAKDFRSRSSELGDEEELKLEVHTLWNNFCLSAANINCDWLDINDIWMRIEMFLIGLCPGYLV